MEHKNKITNALYCALKDLLSAKRHGTGLENWYRIEANAQNAINSYEKRTSSPEQLSITLLFASLRGDKEHWTQIWTYAYEGDLPPDEEDILLFVWNHAESYEPRQEGVNIPGWNYAHPPHLQIFPGYLVITQTGGMDI